MKKRKAKARSLVPKRLGKSAVSKKPWKSRKYLDWVKEQPCFLLPFYGTRNFPVGICEGPMDPHHCRKLLPSGLLPRHDSLAIPLCRKHHRGMDGNEREFWRAIGVDPRDFIRSTPEGRAALAMIEGDGSVVLR